MYHIYIYIYIYDPHGNIFIQKDEMAMGSVWGAIFRNFYVSALENKVFNTIKRPNSYLRYADNILLLINSTYESNTIQETFQNISVLNFTQEINISNKIPFLGVLIHTSNIGRFITFTFKKKSTNINPFTLDFQSENPFRYKRTIIKTLISWTKVLSSSRTMFLNELKDIKRTLINNGFPNYIVDTEIKQFLNKPDQPNIDNNLNHKQSINLYYKN